MLNGTESDLRLLRVVGARAFEHIETYTKNIELKLLGGRLVGYSNNSKSSRVYNSATRFIMERRNVIFIDTPSRQLPPPSEETPPQLLRWERDDHNYITDNDFPRHNRNLTTVLNPLLSAPADHIAAGGLSTNSQEAEVLDWISDITRRDMLQGECSRLWQERVPSWGISLDGQCPGERRERKFRSSSRCHQKESLLRHRRPEHRSFNSGAICASV